MKIVIGSKNKVKIDAFKEMICDYDLLKGSEVLSFKADSKVDEQPKDFGEFILGAKNRARTAFFSGNFDLGIGLESGINKIPHTKSGWMDFTACVIYDGVDFHVGISSGFDLPPKLINPVLKEGLDLSQACFKSGLTDKRNIGSEEGLIGHLTKGKVTRKDYTKHAIAMALLHLQSKEYY